jgi:hypothetical protein
MEVRPDRKFVPYQANTTQNTEKRAHWETDVFHQKNILKYEEWCLLGC